MIFLNSGGRLPAHMLGVLICCAGQWWPTVILCFLGAPKRRTPVDPRLCCWKKHMQELTNTATITRVSQSQWLLLPSTRTECRCQATKAGQPGAPCPRRTASGCLCRSHWGHSVWRGMAGDGRTTPAAGRLLSPVSLYRKDAGWMSCLQTSVLMPCCNWWQIR